MLLNNFNCLLSRLNVKSLLYVRNNPLLTSSMAKSKFEYVRDFEEITTCLPNTWIVVRLDGKGFHKFTDIHKFKKPNDPRGLQLMSRAAACVMGEFRDVTLAFGHSDEYSIVLKKNANVFKRRKDKILSIVSSVFSSSYVFYWSDYFPDTPLVYPPSFDARIILYPTDDNLLDYLSWRQADVHINNLYNTCFWNLVLNRPCSPKEAEEVLSGTLSADKNEILFNEFGINYNNEPEMFRKGTVLLRKFVNIDSTGKPKHVIVPFNCDIIKKTFWQEHPEILSLSKVPVYACEGTTYFECKQIKKMGEAY